MLLVVLSVVALVHTNPDGLDTILDLATGLDTSHTLDPDSNPVDILDILLPRCGIQLLCSSWRCGPVGRTCNIRLFLCPFLCCLCVVVFLFLVVLLMLL